MDWQPISSAPENKMVLLWWVGEHRPEYPNGPAPATCVVGQVSFYETGQVWANGSYLPMKFFTHWASLPNGPNGEVAGG